MRIYFIKHGTNDEILLKKNNILPPSINDLIQLDGYVYKIKDRCFNYDENIIEIYTEFLA